MLSQNTHLRPTALQSVFDGQRCVGHVLKRGFLGFESFDDDDKSLGTFVSVGDAAKAVLARLTSSSSST